LFAYLFGQRFLRLLLLSMCLAELLVFQLKSLVFLPQSAAEEDVDAKQSQQHSGRIRKPVGSGEQT
jgi:hypothetical protein